MSKHRRSPGIDALTAQQNHNGVIPQTGTESGSTGKANRFAGIACRHCGGQTSNGLALCESARKSLARSLTDVPAYFADLARIRPGERIKASRSVPHSAPPPSTQARRDRIGEALDAATNTLTTWARAFIDDRPQVAGQEKPKAAEYRGDIDPGVVQMRHVCGWLEQHITTIATLEWCEEFRRNMRRTERSLQALVDSADTGWFAGLCGVPISDEEDAPYCERALFATVGARWIRCPECGSTHDVAERREQMIRDSRDEAAPVSVIATSIVGWLDGEASVARLTERIKKWVQRDQLGSAGTRVIAGQVVQTYRIGDVLDLVQRDTRRVRDTAG